MASLLESYNGKFGLITTVVSIMSTIIIAMLWIVDTVRFKAEVRCFIEEQGDAMEQVETFMYLQHGINERHETLFLINTNNANISIGSVSGDSP